MNDIKAINRLHGDKKEVQKDENDISTEKEIPCKGSWF